MLVSLRLNNRNKVAEFTFTGVPQGAVSRANKLKCVFNRKGLCACVSECFNIIYNYLNSGSGTEVSWQTVNLIQTMMWSESSGIQIGKKRRRKWMSEVMILSGCGSEEKWDRWEEVLRSLAVLLWLCLNSEYILVAVLLTCRITAGQPSQFSIWILVKLPICEYWCFFLPLYKCGTKCGKDLVMRVYVVP